MGSNNFDIEGYVDEDPNVLAKFSTSGPSGDMSATILTTTASALNGDVMLLFPTMDPTHVIVAMDYDTVMATAGPDDPAFRHLIEQAMIMVANHFIDQTE